MTFRLRKAEEADLDFIWRLRVATMKEAVSQSYGWDEETQRGYAAESLRGEIVLIEHVAPLRALTRQAIDGLKECGSRDPSEWLIEFVRKNYRLVLLTPAETSALNKQNRSQIDALRLEKAGIKIRPRNSV